MSATLELGEQFTGSRYDNPDYLMPLLNSIKNETDRDMQYNRMLLLGENIRVDGGTEFAYDALQHFSRTATEVPILMRAQAFESSLELLAGLFGPRARTPGEDDAQKSRQINQALHPELFDKYTLFKDLLPEFYLARAWFTYLNEPYAMTPVTYMSFAIRDGIKHRAILDGVSEATWLPERMGDYNELPEDYPVAALLLAWKMNGIPDQTKDDDDLVNVREEFWEAAFNWDSPATIAMLREQRGYGDSFLATYYRKLIGHMRINRASEERLDPVELLAMQFTDEFQELYDKQPVLAAMFGEQLTDVYPRYEALLAGMDTSWRPEIRRYAGDIEMANGNFLSFQLRDKELQSGMQMLANVFRYWDDVFQSDTVRTVKSVDGNGFAMYRFIDTSGKIPPIGWVYLRGEPDTVFADSFEYGRTGRGVEASISYCVDVEQLMNTDTKLPNLKVRSGDVFSIRIDREAWDLEDGKKLPNPLGTQSALSLDIGSILGNEQWLSTKMSRLMAFGSQGYEGKISTGLNHHRLANADFVQVYNHANMLVTDRLMNQAEIKRLRTLGSLSVAQPELV